MNRPMRKELEYAKSKMEKDHKNSVKNSYNGNKI